MRHHSSEADQMVPERELEAEGVRGVGMQELLEPAFEPRLEGRLEPTGTKGLKRQIRKSRLDTDEGDVGVDRLIPDSTLHAATDLERHHLGALSEGLVGLKRSCDVGDNAKTAQPEESAPYFGRSAHAARAVATHLTRKTVAQGREPPGRPGRF